MNTASYIDELTLVVRQTFRLLHQKSQVPIEVRAATMLQRAALSYLADRHDTTMSNLAEGLQMSLSSSTQLIERLVKEGFVGRRHDRQDHRIVRITINEKGKEELARLNRLRGEKLRKIFSLVPPEDLKELLRIHKNILQKLQNQT